MREANNKTKRAKVGKKSLTITMKSSDPFHTDWCFLHMIHGHHQSCLITVHFTLYKQHQSIFLLQKTLVCYWTK